MTSRLKDIPTLERDGKNLGTVIAAVREVIQTFRGYRGDPRDRALTLRDLSTVTQTAVLGGGTVDGGTGGTTIIGGGGDGGGGGVTPDLTAPPTATGLAVTAGLTSLYIACDTPTYTQGHEHDRTVVYGAIWPDGDPEPTFSDAVELFQFQGTFSAYSTDPGTRWCIWIKWRSNDGVLSADPAGGTNGVQATTVLVNSPDLAVNAIAAGTAYITDAKIADISAAKLTVGDGTIGGNLKSSNYIATTSGWILTPAGYLEAQNAMIRGTIYADAGLIGGITIASNSIKSGQTAFDTGTGFYLGDDGTFSMGNSAGNKLTWNGTVLNVVGGGTFSGNLSAAGGTFSGNLSAAGGTFSGNLSAAGGTFSGNLSAAGGTFAGALSAASGTFAGTLTAGAVNAVNTINLAGQAVTIPTSTYTAGTVGPFGSESTMQGHSFTSSGAPVFIHFCCYILGDGSGALSSLTVRVKRGATTVYTIVIQIPAYSTGELLSLSFVDTPGAGGVSYTITGTPSAGTLTATARALLTLEVKK